MNARIVIATEKVLPVSETEFRDIKAGDIVRYQTKETGHRCGVVKERDVKRKRACADNKHLHNNRAPLIVTIGVGSLNRKTVSLTREQLLEWRPAIVGSVTQGA